MLICASTNIQIYQRVTMDIMAVSVYTCIGVYASSYQNLDLCYSHFKMPKIYVTQINDKNPTASETNVN